MSDPFLLTENLIDKWKNEQDINLQINDLKPIVEHYSNLFEIHNINNKLKMAYCSFLLENYHNQESTKLKKLQLELLKIIFRDKSNPDLECYENITELLFNVSCLNVNEEHSTTKFDSELILEAEKCLINLLFYSAKARQNLEKAVLDNLTDRISTLHEILYNKILIKNLKTNYSYLSLFSNDLLKELYFFDLKIAFVTSAQMLTIQQRWVNETDKTDLFFNVLAKGLDSFKQYKDFFSTIEYKITELSLKILFNVYCHEKIIDSVTARKFAHKCAEIVISNDYNFELKQLAVNLLATMPTILGELCPKIDSDVATKLNEVEVYEDHNILFAKKMLELFEESIEKLTNSEVQLLGTFFTVMIHLYSKNKAARRYGRLKIIPPLTAKHVEVPPEEGTTLRNKIIQLMKSVSSVHDLAAELLFVLCKRSVNRMIKYCGFGHSAGLLANSGYLGASMMTKKSESDSENSETEDYKKVENKVNPITGYIPSEEQLEEYRKTIESMSDEQKEYEAIKLANTFNKLMDKGVMAPATIGPDGRPKQMEHVAEFIKDAKEETGDDESD